jgi:hypothetical protein
MRLLLTISLLLCPLEASAGQILMLVQRTPLAGSQYYAVEARWNELRVGDALSLEREPDNRHDARAIRIRWQGEPLGYLPRARNRAVSAAMDRGQKLVGRIAELTRHPDPWRRVVVEVYAEL